MESIENLYEHYYNLLERIQESDSDNLSTNLLQYGITEDYYNQIPQAPGEPQVTCVGGDPRLPPGG